MKRILSFFVLSLLCIRAFSAPGISSYRLPASVGASDYLCQTIVIRVKSQYRASCSPQQVKITSLENKLKLLGTVKISRKFPQAQPPEGKMNAQQEPLADLSMIYEVQYSVRISVEKAINMLLPAGVLEYAEPHFTAQAFYNPSDPSTGTQYYLTNIRAYQGWNISKGDTNVVIGITDTGFDMTHPDLKGNIKHNYADPVNGLDDDNDGYKDNFSGWDLGQRDNDPTANTTAAASGNKPYHGVVVSGCAAAVTDNNTGIAGVGFKCRFLPVKITDSTGIITQGYEGIVYAADHGCQVINCSWGAPDGGSRLGQDVVNYAANNRGALVVAAAGNSDNEIPFFPASYRNVLSVAATNITDKKWVASSYGIYVDVCAPGESIYSTDYNGGYKLDNGTSFSSPIAAACAAVVKSYFPSYTPVQVSEQLRVTSDLIDTVTGNSMYAEKLGAGRVNLYRALTVSGPAVRIVNKTISDHNDSLFTMGDTLRIVADFKNFLAPTGSLSVTLSSASPYVSVQNPLLILGPVGTMATVSHAGNPFNVVVLPGTPGNTSVVFKVSYSDGTYSDREYFEVTINPDYLSIDINDVVATITGRGRIGYNGASTDGNGVSYKGGMSVTYEMGLLIGADTTKVSDCIRGAGASPDDDFANLYTARKVMPSVYADQEILTRFNDNNAGAGKLGVSVTQRVYGWKNAPDNKYIILEYTIRNNSAKDYPDLYAGLFSDWDILNPIVNKSSVDGASRIGYAFSTDPNTVYVGVKLLSPQPFNSYAFDNSSGGNGGINIFDDFTTAEKYKALSTTRSNSGNPSGNDISNIVSAGPVNLLQGDSVRIAFAILISDSLKGLKDAGKAAGGRYDKLLTAVPVRAEGQSVAFSLFPNPAQGHVSMRFISEENRSTRVDIYNLTGEKIKTSINGILPPGEHVFNEDISSLKSGVYFVHFVSGSNNSVSRLVVFR